ncbi:MAG: C4-type zinc ribbon domain-containing protein [Nocardioides sp.]|uniref:zinc ribbon domain-containing protein n=1 Tax=Nocardioides sp. TaxID=35761 RepID=UPI0039E5B235
MEAVKARRARDQQRMDSGAVGNPKDLERMQGELASLERRISVLEDEELEVMEQLETAQDALAEFERRIAEIDEKAQVATAEQTAQLAEIDAQLAEIAAERAPATEPIPADLLTLYDRLREREVIGAAELRARQCQGCMLTLDPAELARIRGLAPDEVVRCEECSRILVRTSESGL